MSQQPYTVINSGLTCWSFKPYLLFWTSPLFPPPFYRLLIAKKNFLTQFLSISFFKDSKPREKDFVIYFCYPLLFCGNKCLCLNKNNIIITTVLSLIQNCFQQNMVSQFTCWKKKKTFLTFFLQNDLNYKSFYWGGREEDILFVLQFFQKNFR